MVSHILRLVEGLNRALPRSFSKPQSCLNGHFGGLTASRPHTTWSSTVWLRRPSPSCVHPDDKNPEAAGWLDMATAVALAAAVSAGADEEPCLRGAASAGVASRYRCVCVCLHAYAGHTGTDTDTDTRAHRHTTTIRELVHGRCMCVSMYTYIHTYTDHLHALLSSSSPLLFGVLLVY
jgi:hypothetical protein